MTRNLLAELQAWFNAKSTDNNVSVASINGQAPVIPLQFGGFDRGIELFGPIYFTGNQPPVVQANTKIHAFGGPISIGDTTVMDNVYLGTENGHKLTIGNGGILAHMSGSTATSQDVVIADKSFLNIGTKVDNTNIAPETYLGPGLYVASDNPLQKEEQGKTLFHAPQRHTYPSRYQATNNHVESFQRPAHRLEVLPPIVLIDEQGKWLTAAEANALKKKDLKNVTQRRLTMEEVAELTENNLDTLLDILNYEHNSHIDQRQTSFPEWLAAYSSYVQLKKDINRQEAAYNYSYGPRAYYGAGLQADLIHLSNAIDVLEQMEANELADKAKALVHAYAHILNDTRANADTAQQVDLKDASQIIKAIQQTISNISDLDQRNFSVPETRHGKRIFFTSPEDKQSSLTATHLNNLFSGLDVAAQRSEHLVQRFLSIFKQPLTIESSNHLELPDKVKDLVCSLWQHPMNKFNTEALTGAIQAYQGHIPFIDQDVRLIGTDIAGVVVLKNVDAHNTSIRSENANLPVVVKDSFLVNTSLHTATREQHSLRLDNVYAIGAENQKVFIHGQILKDVIMLGNVIGADESWVEKAIALHGTVIDDSVRLKDKNAYTLFTKNVAAEGEALKGNIDLAHILSATQQEDLRNKLEISTADFKAALAQPQTFINQIKKYIQKQKTSFSHLFETQYAAKQGAIVQLAPQLKIMALHLKRSHDLFDAAQQIELAKKSDALQTGIHYLLGLKKDLNASAAKALEHLNDYSLEICNGLSMLANTATLGTIAIEVNRFKKVPFSFDEIHKSLKKAKPKLSIDASVFSQSLNRNRPFLHAEILNSAQMIKALTELLLQHVQQNGLEQGIAKTSSTKLKMTKISHADNSIVLPVRTNEKRQNTS